MTHTNILSESEEKMMIIAGAIIFIAELCWNRNAQGNHFWSWALSLEYTNN